MAPDFEVKMSQSESEELAPAMSRHNPMYIMPQNKIQFLKLLPAAQYAHQISTSLSKKFYSFVPSPENNSQKSGLLFFPVPDQ